MFDAFKFDVAALKNFIHGREFIKTSIGQFKRLATFLRFKVRHLRKGNLIFRSLIVEDRHKIFIGMRPQTAMLADLVLDLL